MKQKILVVATGASTIHKTRKLIDILKKEYEVKVIVSDFARKNFDFINDLEPEFLNSNLDESPEYLELGKWADAVVVYPATANTMAKYAAGISDSMLATALFTARKSILFFPSINSDTSYEGLMKRDIPRRIEALGDIVVWPQNIYENINEFQNSIICEPEDAIKHIDNVVRPLKRKAIILFSAPTISIDSNQVRSLATPAAIRVLKRAFTLQGFSVEAIDVTNKLNDNVVVEKLIKSDWDVLVSTISLEDRSVNLDNMPLDLQVNYNSLGKIRMMYPKRVIVGFKYCEDEVDALRKLHNINLDGILWNKTSLMTDYRITGKFFILGHSYDIKNLMKEEAAMVIARGVKEQL